MTEVPEHLLRRSKERRAALGLGGDGEEGGDTPAAAPAAKPAPSSAPAMAEATAVQPDAGGGVATLEREAPAPIVKVRTRTKTPFWVMPVLAALPVYAFIYFGAFGNRAAVNANDPVTVGGGLFASSCATCHGANGEGGVGPQLSGGQVLKTWPNVADHISWVHTGGAPFVGKTYGAQGHTVPATNVMPAFAGNLTDAQITDVVCYERVVMGGAKEAAPDCPVTAPTG